MAGGRNLWGPRRLVLARLRLTAYLSFAKAKRPNLCISMTYAKVRIHQPTCVAQQSIGNTTAASRGLRGEQIPGNTGV